MTDQNGRRRMMGKLEPLTLTDCVDGIGRQRAIHRPSGTEGIVCGYSLSRTTPSEIPRPTIVALALNWPHSDLAAPLADFDRAD